jgi:hypothetical protein
MSIESPEIALNFLFSLFMSILVLSKILPESKYYSRKQAAKRSWLGPTDSVATYFQGQSVKECNIWGLTV